MAGEHVLYTLGIEVFPGAISLVAGVRWLTAYDAPPHFGESETHGQRALALPNV